MTEHDERALFERSIAFTGFKFADGHYANADTQLRWVTWQAASAESRRREEGLRAECEAAARYTEESPCDPDITKDQITAYAIYEPFYRARLAALSAQGQGDGK